MIYYNPSSSIIPIKMPSTSIAWLFPPTNLNLNPSNRLRRFQFIKYFKGKSQGFFSGKDYFFSNSILYESPYLRGSVEDVYKFVKDFDIIVIFNVDAYDGELCKFLISKNKIVIFDHCENIFGLGAEDEIMKNVSAISCCSRVLADYTDKYLKSKGLDKPIFVIGDPIDDSVKAYKDLENIEKNNNMALIMGMGANIQYVLPFLETVCSNTGYDIKILTEADFSFPYKTKIWDIESWIPDALSCSVALCYHDINRFPAKGNIKVTNPMSLGLPVIAAPIEAYKEAIDRPEDITIAGFISYNFDEWCEKLNYLKDKKIQELVGKRAKECAYKYYSMDKISLDYLSMLGYLQQ